MLYDNVLTYDSTMESYWSTQSLAPDTVKTAQSANLIGGSLMQAVFTRTTSAGLTEDKAVFGIHLAMRPGVAGVYDQLEASDCGAVEGQFVTKFWTPLLPIIANDWTLSQIVWRNYGADFPQSDKGLCKYSPVFRAGNQNHPGTAVGFRLPDQIASTVTLRTASRRHWGRFYVGGFTVATSGVADFGRVPPATVDQLALSATDFFEAIQGFSRVIEPVVWSAKYRGIMSINEVTVDDVFDVIRRRRSKQRGYVKVHSAA